jgi:hypothetical protein
LHKAPRPASHKFTWYKQLKYHFESSSLSLIFSTIMKFFFVLALLAMLATAAPVAFEALVPLKVTLEMVGNTKVKANITNPNIIDLKALKSGTLLDDTECEKFNVFSGCKLPF